MSSRCIGEDENVMIPGGGGIDFVQCEEDGVRSLLGLLLTLMILLVID